MKTLANNTPTNACLESVYSTKVQLLISDVYSECLEKAIKLTKIRKFKRKKITIYKNQIDNGTTMENIKQNECVKTVYIALFKKCVRSLKDSSYVKKQHVKCLQERRENTS